MDRIQPSVYSLNTSFTKQAVISLEYDSAEQSFVPKLRLTGHDWIGVPFDQECWNEFKAAFEEITVFFCSYNQKIFGRRIAIGKHTLNFTTSHCDRAIEISENFDEVDEPRSQKKKYAHNIIYKFNTFGNLKKIAKCIDNQFAVLKKIALQLDALLDEFSKKLYMDIQSPQESQYFMMTAQVIESSDISLRDEDILKIKQCEKIDLSDSEISVILYEFLCLKPDYIAYRYNMLFDQSNKMN